MENDDLYPSDGSYFLPKEPADQKVARQKERAKTLETINVLKDIVNRLENRIEFYASVDAMPDDVKDDPVKFMNMHNANELTRDNLRSEKEYIESLIETHIR